MAQMVNPGNMLIVRPHDCHYCGNGYFALLHVVEYANSKGIWQVTDLEGTQAEQQPVFDALSQYDPLGFYGFGHGSSTRYTGNSEADIFNTTMDLSPLSQRIIYLMSCLTAAQLGQKIIDAGAKSYAGFMQEWTWMVEGSADDDPYSDKYGKCFFESANQLWVSMIDGATFQQAIDSSIAKYNEWINYWFTTGDPNTSSLVGWLAHDRDILIGLGDMTATLQAGSDPMNQYTTQAECLSHNGYWWINGTCHSFPENIGPTPPNYDFIKQYLPYIAIGGAIAVLFWWVFFR